MARAVLLLAALLITHSTASNANAQLRSDQTPWTVLGYRVALQPALYNTRGLEDVLSANAFDDSQEFDLVGGTLTLEYPQAGTQTGGWSMLAAYAVRPWIRAGGALHRAVTVTADGYRQELGRAQRVTLQHSMWSFSPIALWRGGRAFLLGGGPAVIRGTTLLLASSETGDMNRVDESTFLRVGAIVFGSVGYTIIEEHLYVGLQVQFLYGGTPSIGPFDSGPFALSPTDVSVSQLAGGPVVALHF
jgi:hypothetical protein